MGASAARPPLDPEIDPEQTRTAEASLTRLAGLLGLAIGNAEGRQQLLHRASTDPLTGLANHRTFHERLAEEMARCRRYNRPISVAMLDIDNFKEINDTAGHLVGDSVLADRRPPNRHGDARRRACRAASAATRSG